MQILSSAFFARPVSRQRGRGRAATCLIFHRTNHYVLFNSERNKKNCGISHLRVLYCCVMNLWGIPTEKHLNILKWIRFAFPHRIVMKFKSLFGLLPWFSAPKPLTTLKFRRFMYVRSHRRQKSRFSDANTKTYHPELYSL